MLMINVYMKNRAVLSAAGMLAAAFYAAAFFTDLSSGLMMLFKITAFFLAAVLYALFCINIDGKSLKKQIIVINMAIFAVHFILGLASFKTVIYIRYFSAIAQILIWTVTPAALLVRSFLKDRTSWTSLADSLRLYRAILTGAGLIAAVEIFLSYDAEGPVFLWSSNLAYNFILRNVKLLNLFEPRKMVFSDHIAFSFFYPVSILSELFGSIDIGYYVYDMLFVVIASVGFALLFRALFPGKKDSVIIFATAVCMMAPFVTLPQTIQMYDYIALCTAPILLWTIVEDKKALFLAVGAFTSFIKEPGVMYFASLCAVSLFWELFHEKKRIRSLLFEPLYYFEILIGIIFSVVYLSIGNYGSKQISGLGFDVSHIIDILKVFCVLNYNWVLAALSLSVVLYTAFSKGVDKKIKRTVLLISIPAVVYLLLNTLVQDGVAPRYTDFFYPSLLILSVTFIMIIPKKEKLSLLYLGALAALFLLADLTSVDPVSDRLLYKVDVGETKLYSASASDFYADSSVYNRQCYGFDLAMNKVFEKALENSDDILAVSTGGDRSSWQISGKWDIGDMYNDCEEYWDTERHMRAPGFITEFRDDPKYRTMVVKYIYDQNDTAAELKKGKTFTYIYMPSFNCGKEDIVRSNFDIIEEGDFTARGWTVAYLRGR